MALLLHVILILLSIAEVAFYSYLVEPGHDQKYYEAHAEQSGPWISTIAGSLLCFVLVRRYCRKFSTRKLTYALALPLVYMAFDIIILLAAGAGADSINATSLMSGSVKLGASLLAYYVYRSKTIAQTL
ncbi:MAG TPA: hypothetical protein VEB40_10270 [Flavipsychrobacter sp.]|nr:hypothetical protein [Flavipsychrobacter sp.]